MSTMLDFDQISPHSKVLINLPDGQTVVGFLSDNVTFSGSAKYGDFSDNLLTAFAAGSEERAKMVKALQNAMGTAGDVLSGGVRIGQQWLGLNIPEMKQKTINSTVVTWNDSPRFAMTINMMFVAYKRSLDVKKPVRALVRCTYPHWKASTLLVAPNEYNAQSSTCVSLKIGNWLKIPKLLLINSASFSFSKETLVDGNPLFAYGPVGFEAYRQIDANTIAQFLRDSRVAELADEDKIA